MQLISEWICIGIPKVGLRFTLFTVSLLISFKPYTCWTFQNLERCFQGSDAVPQILEGRHQGLVQAALGKKLQLQSFMDIGSSLKCWYEIYIYIGSSEVAGEVGVGISLFCFSIRKFPNWHLRRNSYAQRRCRVPWPGGSSRFPTSQGSQRFRWWHLLHPGMQRLKGSTRNGELVTSP